MLRQPSKAILLVVLALGLALWPPAVWADDSTGAPEAGPSAPLTADVAPASATGAYHVFLPYLTQANGSPTVDIQNRQSSLTFFQQEFQGTQTPSSAEAAQSAQAAAINWTGSHAACNPGTTDASFRQAILRRINYFRAMAGVPASITFSDDSNRKAQAAALIMSANRALSHSPPSNWACYSTDGADGAGSSNLYLGAYGGDAILGYMRDAGGGNGAVGHRRWILYPQTQTMGTGDIPAVNGYPAANTLRVFDAHMWEARPAVRDTFVSWPPAGYVPYPVVFARWSFSYPGADFSAARVSMRTGSTSISVAQSGPDNGYGENTLVWIPMGLSDSASWPRPTVDTTYVVTVQNVNVNNQSRSFTYNVIVFDPQ
jgi:uncharacterized protein YkwD